MDAPDVRDAVSRISRLPTLPTVLGQIMEALSDPDTSALELGKHIAADQSLSATLLKQVNSAFYGFYRRVTTVKDAVVILGFREVQNLVLAASAFRVFPKSSSAYDRNQLWRHSLATAMAAERIAKRLSLSADGSYFSAGLLHDIGKVALDSVYPDNFQEAVKRAVENQIALHEVEPEVFGMDHAEVGGALAEHWNLPPLLTEAIRRHHTPEQAMLSPELAHVTALANHLAYEANLGEATNVGPHDYPVKSAMALKIDPGHSTAIVAELQEATDRIDAMLGATAM
ncbi:MAG TPA: HDOD domain-containing protein [Candidatus Hydrogenedentes bacterium]|nr:HDOD domain-containing protein [Candidatus Hydrogenedentota bacterium]